MEEWPGFFPDECPPSESLPMTGICFRFVLNEKPFSEWIMSPWELKKKKDWTLPKGDDCADCALSAFETPNQAIEFITVCKMFKKFHLALFKIETETGVRDTDRGDGHFNWWLPLRCDKLSLERDAEIFAPPSKGRRE
jgi:hypothetical protein